MYVKTVKAFAVPTAALQAAISDSQLTEGQRAALQERHDSAGTLAQNPLAMWWSG